MSDKLTELKAELARLRSGNLTAEDHEIVDNFIDSHNPLIEIFGVSYAPSLVLLNVDSQAVDRIFDKILAERITKIETEINSLDPNYLKAIDSESERKQTSKMAQKLSAIEKIQQQYNQLINNPDQLAIELSFHNKAHSNQLDKTKFIKWLDSCLSDEINQILAS